MIRAATNLTFAAGLLALTFDFELAVYLTAAAGLTDYLTRRAAVALSHDDTRA